MDKPKMLIIDDDRNHCESLTDILEANGYLADSTYTSEDGIKKAQEGFYNIILLDMKLPNTDGIKTLERVMEISQESEVIIFADNVETGAIIEAMERGAFSYVTKPYEITDLLDTVKKAYEKQALQTENRKLFKQICESKKDWEDTFDSIQDMISLHDLEFNIIKCNKAFANVFHSKPEYLIGRKCHGLFHCDNKPYSECPFRRCKETLMREFEELYIPHLGGVFQLTCFPKFDKTGELNGIVHIGKDITRQKSDEARIIRQGNLLNAINRVFEDALGCDTEEELGASCLTVAEELTGSRCGFIGELNPETGLFDTIAISDSGWDACKMPEMNAVRLIKNMRIRGIDRTTLKEEKSRIVNDPASHPDRTGFPSGHPPITAFLGVPLKYDGRTIGMIALANKESGYDMHDQEAVEALSVTFVEALMRKRADTELKRSEERYAAVSDLTTDYIYHICVASDGQITVDWITEDFTRSTGYTVDDIKTSEMWKNVIHPDDIDSVMDVIRKVIEGETGNVECRIITKGGETEWLHVYGQPEWDDTKQGVTGIIGAVANITERKRYEQRILDASEIDETLLTVSNIISITRNSSELIENTLETVYKFLGGRYLSAILWEEDTKSFNTIRGKGREGTVTNILRTIRFREPYPSFINSVMESKTYFVVKSEDTDKETDEFMREIGAEMLMIVPLLTIGKVSGFLLYCRESDYQPDRRADGRDDSEGFDGFTYKEGAVIKGVAGQLSLGIANAGLYEALMNKTAALENMVEMISVMRELDRAILSNLEPAQIFETSAQLVGRIIPCDRVTIVTIDKEKGGFLYSAGWGVKLKKGAFVRFEETNTTEVVRTKMPVVRLNIAEKKDLLPFDRLLLDQGFLSDIRMPLIIKGEIYGILNIGSRRRAVFSPEDISIARDIAAQISVAMSNANLITELRELHFNTVKTLSVAIDAKSKWTKGHTDRVTDMSMLIGKELSMEVGQINDLRFAAILHDIGKIGVNEYILDKPGRLTEDEWNLMKQHPVKGAEMIADIRQFKEIIPAIRHHHERYNGGGYPDGLRGKEIPLFARIIMVADSFDALTSERPYRKGLSREVGIEEIRKGSGTQFDPEIVRIFLKTTGFRI